jgi:hypothetical protein
MRARLHWAAALVTVLLLAVGPLLALAPPVSAAETMVLSGPTSVEVPGDVEVTATTSLARSVVFWITPETGEKPSCRPIDSTPDDSSQAFSCSVTFSLTKPGKYTISAQLVDTDVIDSLQVTATAPPPPAPVVTITSPADDTSSELGTSVTISARVDGGDGTGTWELWARFADQEIASQVRFTSDGRTITASYGPSSAGTVIIKASWRDDAYSGQSSEDTVQHHWIAAPPTVSISRTSPDTANSLVGGSLSFTVTVGGDASGGALVVSVAGANPVAALQYSESGGTYTGRYTSTKAGLDTVTATWKGRGQASSDAFTHTWDPPRVQLSVTPSSGDLGNEAVIGVGLPDGTLGGALGVHILEGGPHAGVLVASGDGTTFEARYDGRSPGTDRIEAVLKTRYGDFSSNIGTKVWNTPIVTLVQDVSQSALGAAHTISAEVSGTTDSTVAFDVSGANGGAGVNVSGGHPTHAGTYVGAVDGEDFITATATVFGRTYESTALRHTWVRPTVTVNQDLETSKPGETVLLTATVDPAGTAGSVTFSVGGVGSPLTLLDDGTDGSYTASYTRDDEGTDTITATLASGSADFESDAITHVWDDESVPAAVLSPAGATNCVGSSFTPTVTLIDGDDPLPGVAVQVTVTMPGAADQVLTATTDVDGRATVSYSAAAPGTDTLVATAEVDSETLTSAPLTHLWEACELVVSVAPPGTTSLVGSSFTPTVSVRDATGDPVADATVDMTITMVEPPDQPEVTVILTTDANGLASTTYDRSVEGTDRIDAVVTAGERTGRATIDHFWRVQEDLRVTLGPAGTASVAGSPFTATALVTVGESPVPEAQVAFRATLAGQEGIPEEDITLEAVTDEDGQASFTFTRPVAGIDTVQVEASVGDRSGRASIVHQWDLVPGLKFTIEPPGTSSLLDEQFAATATVLLEDAPVADAEIVFVATQPDQGDRTGAARTGTDGRATFTYTRDTVGTDLVTATVVLADGRRGEASMTHLWRSDDEVAPPPPEPPTVEARGVIVPAGLATVVGTGCPRLTQVLLFVNGDQVATTQAGRDGTYQTDVRLPAELTVGQYPLEARCDPVTADNEIAVVAPASTGGSAGAEAVTAVATFSFFVLLGGQLVKGAGGYSAGGG